MACRRTRLARASRLPFARARQLPDLPDDDVALDAAQVVDEQLAVEMVHLVLERARQQARALALMFRAFTIEAFDNRPRRPDDGGFEPGQAETAFFFELHPFADDELRVDHDDESVRIAADRNIDDEDPERNTDLRRGEPDSRRRIHRVDHVAHEDVDVGRDGGDVDGFVVERAGSVFENGSDHDIRDDDNRRARKNTQSSSYSGKSLTTRLIPFRASKATLKFNNNSTRRFENLRYEISCARCTRSNRSIALTSTTTAPFDEEVDPVAVIERLVLVFHRKWFLALDAETLVSEFEAQTGFVRVFE